MFLPIRGTASDVAGMDSATKFKNTVNERRIVTPAKMMFFYGELLKKKRCYPF